VISIVVGFEWAEFIWILVRLPVAVWLIATGFIGYDSSRLGFAERGLRLLAAITMLITFPSLQIGGFVVGLGIVVVHRVRAKRNASEQVATGARK